jgi:hypothetical protein
LQSHWPAELSTQLSAIYYPFQFAIFSAQFGTDVYAYNAANDSA